MLLESRLQRRYQRTFDLQLCIAPVVFVLRMARPFFGETNSPGETKLAVNHQDSAMRPPIGPIDSPGMGRMIIGEFATGRPHLPDIGIVQPPAGANSVEDDANLDAGARAIA